LELGYVPQNISLYNYYYIDRYTKEKRNYAMSIALSLTFQDAKTFMALAMTLTPPWMSAQPSLLN
jgi:hypothetical protein